MNFRKRFTKLNLYMSLEFSSVADILRLLIALPTLFKFIVFVKPLRNPFHSWKPVSVFKLIRYKLSLKFSRKVRAL